MLQPTIMCKNNEKNDKFYRKVVLCIRKWLILGLEAGKQLRSENHTVDWELDFHPGDNGHVTH